MPYCSLEDILKSIPESNIIQLTDDSGTGAIDQVKVDEAIAYAEQLINGYLRGRYPVPLSPVPELIRHLAVDLAIFHLYSRRFELEMPESMMAKYKNAIKLLEQIQKGLITLGIESADTGPGQGYYKTNKTAEDKTFSKDVLNKF
jgi:phage gp36-like protein